MSCHSPSLSSIERDQGTRQLSMPCHLIRASDVAAVEKHAQDAAVGQVGHDCFRAALGDPLGSLGHVADGPRCIGGVRLLLDLLLASEAASIRAEGSNNGAEHFGRMHSLVQRFASPIVVPTS